jgi:hypothetical protein
LFAVVVVDVLVVVVVLFAVVDDEAVVAVGISAFAALVVVVLFVVAVAAADDDVVFGSHQPFAENVVNAVSGVEVRFGEVDSDVGAEDFYSLVGLFVVHDPAAVVVLFAVVAFALLVVDVFAVAVADADAAVVVSQVYELTQISVWRPGKSKHILKSTYSKIN